MKAPGVKPPPVGHAIRVVIEGTPVAVFNWDGILVGVDAACTHVGGPLERGTIDGAIVNCPWHGSEFDLRTGAAVRGPASRPLRRYLVRIVEDGLEIEPIPT
jgi:nitrite reductase/ring-hydroxylating ferredoxin subunit